MNRISPQTAKGKRFKCTTESLDGVRLKGVKFIGEDTWFPKGAVTILGGRKRSGKSTLCLYECAKFSAAGGHILIVQQEDPEGLLKAKLKCMNAEMGNIHVFHRKEIGGGMDMKTDMEAEFDGRNLGDIIKATERIHADFVYIDPLHALASGRMNDQRSADCMIPLNALAKRTGCCVLGVLHAHKSPKDVEYAMSGSDQWVAKARSYLYLEADPNDTDAAVCQQVDSSYSEPYNARIEFGMREILGDDGISFPVRIVTGVSATNVTAQDYLDLKNGMKDERVDPVIREVMAEWVRVTIHLNGNRMFAKELFRQAEEKDRNWTPSKIRKAFAMAGVRQTRAAEKHSRSIVYLEDAAEYAGGEMERLKIGVTPEQLAKEWALTIPR